MQQSWSKFGLNLETMDQHVPDNPAVPNRNADYKAMVLHDGHYFFGNPGEKANRLGLSLCSRSNYFPGTID